MEYRNTPILTGVKDVDWQILNELNDKSLVNACQSSKQINKICNDDMFWFQRTIEKFHLNPRFYKQANKSYYQFYQELAKIPKKELFVEAAKRGYLPLVEYFILEGTNIHANDDAALLYAAENGHLNVVEYLKNNKMKVNQCIGITKKNEQCKKVAQSGCKYCHLHNK